MNHNNISKNIEVLFNQRKIICNYVIPLYIFMFNPSFIFWSHKPLRSLFVQTQNNSYISITTSTVVGTLYRTPQGTR